MKALMRASWMILASAVLLACGPSEEEVQSEIFSKATQVKVSASKLYADYEANEIAADERYKGKIIEVRGKVSNIGEDLTGTLYVALETKNLLGSVQGMVPKSWKRVLANLRKGMLVTLKCKGDGKLINVILRGCSIDFPKG